MLRLALDHHGDQLRHLFIGVGAGTSGSKLVVQSRQSALLIAPAPMADHRRADSAAPRHFPVGLAFARQQYDPRAPHQRIRHALRAHQRTQLLSVRVADR